MPTVHPTVHPSVQATGLTRYFRSGDDTVTAVEDVSLTVGRGEIAAVIGPSGSGKSTLADQVVAREPGASVVRMDDLLEGWDGLAGVDGQLSGLLRPLAAANDLHEVRTVRQSIGRSTGEATACMRTDRWS